MMIKNIILIAVFSWWLIGCDSRVDELDQYNDGPYFGIDSDTVDFLSDSLKLSQGDFQIVPRIIDVNNNLTNIEFIEGSGSGVLKVNEESVQGTIGVWGQSLLSLRYDPSTNGSHRFTIRAIDAFGLTADLEVDLTAFINIPPTLIATIGDAASGGPFERVIDASKSFDGDERFGGRIVEYEYTFLSITRNISDDTQTVIFPSAGNYQALVRVMDNDNVWTDLLTIPIKIE